MNSQYAPIPKVYLQFDDDIVLVDTVKDFDVALLDFFQRTNQIFLELLFFTFLGLFLFCIWLI